MNKFEYVKYFRTLHRRFAGVGGTGTPDRLQGGIGVIRQPDAYDVETLAYWYNECVKAGY